MRTDVGTRTLLAVAAAVAASASWAAPAVAAPDAGLHLTVAPAPSFTVGSQGTIDDFCAFGNPDVYSNARATLTFRATSPSGIAGYDLRATYAGQPPDSPIHQTTNTPLTWNATNYSDDCGGGSLSQVGWRITAHDRAGHSATQEVDYDLSVLRWNNRNAGTRLRGSWSFGPGWTRSDCTCADGGSQDYATAGGKAASFLAHVTAAGTHLGLMMATGPGRGRADVYVDGVHTAVVDTFAAQNTNRIYVWDSGPLSAGSHVVRVVDQGTPGRPRIDINAMGTYS